MTQSSDKISCPKCQASNFANSAVCWQCGQPLSGPDAQTASNQPVGPTPPPPPTPSFEPARPTYAAKPQNYLVWSILTTLFCCLPAGIVSIVYAAQVDSRYASGDYAAALDASNKARTWAWVSFGVGLAVSLIYGVFAFLAVVIGNMK